MVQTINYGRYFFSITLSTANGYQQNITITRNIHIVTWKAVKIQCLNKNCWNKLAKLKY